MFRSQNEVKAVLDSCFESNAAFVFSLRNDKASFVDHQIFRTVNHRHHNVNPAVFLNQDSYYFNPQMQTLGIYMSVRIES